MYRYNQEHSWHRNFFFFNKGRTNLFLRQKWCDITIHASYFPTLVPVQEVLMVQEFFPWLFCLKWDAMLVINLKLYFTTLFLFFVFSQRCVQGHSQRSGCLGGYCSNKKRVPTTIVSFHCMIVPLICEGYVSRPPVGAWNCR